jgi:hypothetical protein
MTARLSTASTTSTTVNLSDGHAYRTNQVITDERRQSGRVRERDWEIRLGPDIDPLTFSGRETISADAGFPKGDFPRGERFARALAKALGWSAPLSSDDE